MAAQYPPIRSRMSTLDSASELTLSFSVYPHSACAATSKPHDQRSLPSFTHPPAKTAAHLRIRCLQISARRTPFTRIKGCIPKRRGVN
ncbi:hypothetical protein MVEN_00005100 [Mycena venus]|uniref:Uncharacterized protein n=1 Tax=Mycena venus TaxID=2733690 RepID=A0A8H7DGM3_9AGAR|nr:hypothetical protein MVEN_00005100 [Mycena venus]